MKQYLIPVCLMLSSLASEAQDSARTDSKLTQATVYFGNGAELTHEAQVNVGANIRHIVINQLAQQIDLNSLQISLPEHVSLLSQQFTLYTPPTPPAIKNPIRDRMSDTILLFQKRIIRYNYLRETENQSLDKTTRLIEAALLTSGNKTVASDEALKLVNALTQKLEKSRQVMFQLNNDRDSLQHLIAQIQQRINELPEAEVKPEKSYGQLILQVLCRQSGSIPVSLSYFTLRAGWLPLYDLRVNSKTNQVKLVYKANLSQSSGFDWKQTKLTLSTSNPNWQGAAPLLQAWYLQWYTPVLYQQVQTTGLAAPATNSYQYYKTEESLKEVIVTADNNGYQLRKLAATQNVEPSTIQQYTTLQQNQLNTQFEISLPYDIKGDGSAHSVAIKEETLNATLKNYAVPKLQPDAFLLAGITDWQTLDLLPGSANIILDNTYIGRSQIDPNSTADTLEISVGKDKRLSIKREQLKAYTSSKVTASNTVQTFTYQITVKNNKSTEVNLTLKDQYPLSQVKEIEIKLLDSGNASVNTDLGILNWQLKLKPGESQKIRFTYSVKYPSDKRIMNL